MKKLTGLERWVFLFTLLFLLASMGWFFLQNQDRTLTRITAEQTQETVLLPEPEESPAPGILEGERININTASAEDLTRLPGIGAVRAADIVTYRETKGAFARIEDITEVSGIGEKTFAKMAPYICVADG